VDTEQIQPASLDLRLGHVAYRVRASFLAGRDRTVADRLSQFQMHEIDLTGGAVLEKGCVYVVPLLESLALPAGMTGAASAKSSIGRLDLLTRVITDHGIEFDRVPEGYVGPLYVEICPRSFSVVAKTGQMLNQIIFRNGKTQMSDDALGALHAQTPIVSGEAVISDGLGFSVDLRPTDGDLVGYRAKPHTGVIDLGKLGHYHPAEYWEEVRTDPRDQVKLSRPRAEAVKALHLIRFGPKIPRTRNFLQHSHNRRQDFLSKSLKLRHPPDHVDPASGIAHVFAALLRRRALCRRHVFGVAPAARHFIHASVDAPVQNHPHGHAQDMVAIHASSSSNISV